MEVGERRERDSAKGDFEEKSVWYVEYLLSYISAYHRVLVCCTVILYHPVSERNPNYKP